MIFSDSKRLLGDVRRAAEKYGMIEENDLIAVGLSGGKDSLALLALLCSMREFYPVPYRVCALTVDAGFPGSDFSPLEALCRELGIEYRIIKTDIAEIVFDLRKEENPCSLCSRMRRGALVSEAESMGAAKLALGHHFDDVVETFIMNLAFEGRLGVFSPVTRLDGRKVGIIRPMIYAKEKDVKAYIKKNPVLSPLPSLCPEDRHTERENVKALLSEQERLRRGVKDRIFKAIEKGGIDGFKDK